MATVGCITIPRYFNYGTSLQAYALQETVKGLGYTYEIIDYADFQTASFYSRLKRWPRMILHPETVVRDVWKKRLLPHCTITRTKRFQAFFENQLQISKQSYFSQDDIARNSPVYDAYICGSDQIWNPGHHHDSTYFLAFAPESKRIAYAPSIGVSHIPKDRQEWLRKMIGGIQYLSLREQAGVELVERITGKKAIHVLDPTLLLTAEQWNKTAANPLWDKPYVLCYILENDSYIRKYAKTLATHLGYDLLILPFQVRDFLDRSVEKIIDAGPREFLGVVRNASIICTDSFHGSVFSIINRKPFYAFRRYDNLTESRLFSRIDGLLTTFGLTSRIVEKGMSIPENPLDIDYTQTDVVLDQEIGKSLSYLSDALRKAVDSA